MTTPLASKALTLIGVCAFSVFAAGCTPRSSYRLESSAESQAPPTPLVPNDRGYVRVESVAGDVGCSINADIVACQRLSGSAYHSGGGHTASVDADGNFQWADADLGELRGRVRLHAGAFSAQGWTIVAGPDQTRFANDHSGHGMTCTSHSSSPF